MLVCRAINWLCRKLDSPAVRGSVASEVKDEPISRNGQGFCRPNSYPEKKR